MIDENQLRGNKTKYEDDKNELLFYSEKTFR